METFLWILAIAAIVIFIIWVLAKIGFDFAEFIIDFIVMILLFWTE